MLSALSSLEPFILVIHFMICIFLVVVILLQAGKGADMGAAFGAGGSQSLFGARGASTFLQKMTTFVAIGFLLTSITLASIHKNMKGTGGGGSVIGDVVPETIPASSTTTPATTESAPVVPAPAPEADVPAAAAPATAVPAEGSAEQPK